MKANQIALICFLFVVGCTAAYYAGWSAGSRQPSASQTAPPDVAMRARERDRPVVKTPPVPAASIPVDPKPRTHGLLLPLPNLKAQDIQDTFHQTRSGNRIHEATDILAPRGTPVYAVVDGAIKRFFNSKQGGLTIYQFDSLEEFCYYYAHLDSYAEGIREGQYVARGTTIGYVGATGNAPPGTPHLHFAIFRLGPEKRWWEGVPINPYPLLIEAIKAR